MTKARPKKQKKESKDMERDLITYWNLNTITSTIEKPTVI